MTQNKPVIALKSGSTGAGARAASSHTGTLAGSARAYDAAFSQCGVIRATSVQDLFDYSVAFAYQPVLPGDRIAIVTNAGGPGIMGTDAIENRGPDPGIAYGRDPAVPGQEPAGGSQHAQSHRRARETRWPTAMAWQLRRRSRTPTWMASSSSSRPQVMTQVKESAEEVCDGC